MTGFYSPEGENAFNTWFPRVAYSWFPGVSLAAVLIMREWMIFGFAATVVFLIHCGVLAFVHWNKVGWIVEEIAARALLIWARARGYVSPQQEAMQMAQVESLRIEGDTAKRAVAMDTIEADIQLAGQRSAWNEQIERLLLIPKRTNAEELQLRQLERNVREIDAASGRVASPEMLSTPMALFGDVGQQTAPRGFLGAVAGAGLGRLQMWLAAALVAFGLSGWAANHFTAGERDEAREELGEARANLETANTRAAEWRAEAEQAHKDVIAARETAAQASRTIQQERERQAARAAQQRRQAREVQDVLTRGNPPDWGLPDATFQPPGSAGADGDLSGSGDPR
jgi:hypothetical protein